jgi:hypothetical protein
VPRLVRALPQQDDELAPPGSGFRLRQRLPLQAADEIEQRLVLGTYPGQFHPFLAQPAQEQRAGCIETAQIAEIERAAAMTTEASLQPLLQRVFRLG